jgi:chromosome segregation ATPase
MLKKQTTEHDVVVQLRKDIRTICESVTQLEKTVSELAKEPDQGAWKQNTEKAEMIAKLNGVYYKGRKTEVKLEKMKTELSDVKAELSRTKEELAKAKDTATIAKGEAKAANEELKMVKNELKAARDELEAALAKVGREKEDSEEKTETLSDAVETDLETVIRQLVSTLTTNGPA